MDDFARSANFGADFRDLSPPTDGPAPPTAPPDPARLPTDPEGLAEALAVEPAVFAYHQAVAEEYRHALDGLKNRRDLCKATAYLDATGTVEERKSKAAADPDAADITRDIERLEHRYRRALNDMAASDVRMSAIKKLLSWRIEEARSLALAEPPARRAVGHQIDLTR